MAFGLPLGKSPPREAHNTNHDKTNTGNSKMNPVVKLLKNGISHPPHHGMSTTEYLSSRFRSLKPRANKVPNPIPLLRMLTARQWSFFLVAFSAWTWDSFDFFTVSLTIRELSEEFGRSKADITWGITLVLMFRSVGSAIFGLFSDRYGRKWPFIVNNILFIILELATGFCQTYEQFLACRALFGLAMGGLYGNAAATALEDCPEKARGIISGILQQGYALGYLLCAAFARALVNTTPHGWRPLFWFGACPPFFFIIWRLFLPENDVYQEHRQLRDEKVRIGDGTKTGPTTTGTFLRQGSLALRKHWLVLTYLVLLMAGFNFLSHGTQDLYPVLLENQLEFSQNMVTVTQVVASLGAILGGTLVGYGSQIVGRRFSIMVCCVAGGALLYPYTFVSTKSIIAAAFFEQFFVQGAWGVVPIHLMELSPGAFRTFVVGTSYQLGNLASSASSTILAKLGERFPLPPMESDGGGKEQRYDYGRVMCIFVGCVYAYLFLLTLLGPEHVGRKFGIEHDAEVRETFDLETISKVVSHREDEGRGNAMRWMEEARRVHTV